MNIFKNRVIVFGFIFVLSIMPNHIFAVDHYVVYNPTDATVNIQTKLDLAAPGDKVIISYQGAGTKWITGPLFINNSGTSGNPIELILEPGVILEAKSGAFPNLLDSMFTIISKDNITITGYGAAIRMLLNEFTDGEARCCILTRSCNNLTIKGVTLERSGGDGIYLGTNGTPNDTVLIEDVICDGNARQGISIISAKNLIINNCTLINTGQYNPAGVATAGPWAGVDFEPNNPNEFIENVVVSNCTIKDNVRHGVLFNLQKMNSTSADISATISNCYIDNSTYGIRFKAGTKFYSSKINAGYINFCDCIVDNSSGNSITMEDWQHDNIDISITNCTLTSKNPDLGTIDISLDENADYSTGNIYFSNVHINKSQTPYALKLSGGNSTYKIKDISGCLYSDHEYAIIDYGTYCQNITATLYKLSVNFDTVFASDIDNIGGVDNETFFRLPEAQIYTGDYNGDGRTDLFVKGYLTWRALYIARADGSGFTRVFLDNESSDAGDYTEYGDGGISGQPHFTDSTAKVYPGDYNGDGKTDLFVKGYGTHRSLYIANSSGTGFIEVFSGDTGIVGGITAGPEFTDSTAQVYPGDYNGDGKTDLFVKGYGTYRLLCTANSTGTGFVEEFNTSLDCQPDGTDSESFLTDSTAKVYPGDYNGDGKTDLFVKGYLTSRALYLASSSGNSFTRAFLGDTDVAGGTTDGPELTDSLAEVYTGDYNGDGKTDLFVKGYGTYRLLYTANSSGNGFVEEFNTDLDNQPDGTDSESFLTHSDAKVYPGDYNGDGKTDLFVKGRLNYRVLYIANISGDSFYRKFLGDNGVVGGLTDGPELNDSTALVYPGDYNGDGKTDLFVKGYLTYRLLYTSGGLFQ